MWAGCRPPCKWGIWGARGRPPRIRLQLSSPCTVSTRVFRTVQTQQLRHKTCAATCQTKLNNMSKDNLSTLIKQFRCARPRKSANLNNHIKTTHLLRADGSSSSTWAFMFLIQTVCESWILVCHQEDLLIPNICRRGLCKLHKSPISLCEKTCPNKWVLRP